MEKYARQALSEGINNADDIHVSGESEIYRVLNLHYNRNNHIEVRLFFILAFLSSPWSESISKELFASHGLQKISLNLVCPV